MFCFIFTFGILSLLLTLNFASVYMWLTSPHLVGLPCQSLTFCQKKCFLHLMRSKLELAIRFRIMRFHLCAYALWIRYSCPLMMVLDRARSAENIGLLKKMTKGSWRGPAAESATFSGTRLLHLRHKIYIEHLKWTLKVCLTFILTKHLNIAKGTTDHSAHVLTKNIGNCNNIAKYV